MNYGWGTFDYVAATLYKFDMCSEVSTIPLPYCIYGLLLLRLYAQPRHACSCFTIKPVSIHLQCTPKATDICKKVNWYAFSKYFPEKSNIFVERYLLPDTNNSKKKNNPFARFRFHLALSQRLHGKPTSMQCIFITPIRWNTWSGSVFINGAQKWGWPLRTMVKNAAKTTHRKNSRNLQNPAMP